MQQRAGHLTAARQHIDEIFLIWLTESQPVNHALLSKLGETHNVPPKGTLEDVTADFGSVEHPPRTKAACIDETLRVPLHAAPRRTAGQAGILSTSSRKSEDTFA